MELEQKVAEILDRMIDIQKAERFSELYDQWRISNLNFHYMIELDHQGYTVYLFETFLGDTITFKGRRIESPKGIESLPMLEAALGILAKKRNTSVTVSFNAAGQPDIENPLKQRGYSYVEPTKPTKIHKIYSKTITLKE